MQRGLGIFLLCCGLSVVSADVTQVCKDKKFGDAVPNPRDCSSYYICGRLPIMNQCEAGLHFDAKLKVCNWPESANCRVDTEVEVLTDATIQHKAEEAEAPMDFELKPTRKNSKKQKEMEKYEEREAQKDLLAAGETESLEESKKEVKKGGKIKKVLEESSEEKSLKTVPKETKKSGKKQKAIEKTFETEALAEAETAMEMENELGSETLIESEKAVEYEILKETSQTMKKDSKKRKQQVEKELITENEAKTAMEAEEEAQKATKKSNKNQKQVERDIEHENDTKNELQTEVLTEAEELELLKDVLKEMKKNNDKENELEKEHPETLETKAEEKAIEYEALNELGKEMPDILTEAKEMEKEVEPDVLIQAEAALATENQFEPASLSEAEAAMAMENQFQPEAPKMENPFELAALSEIEAALEMEAIQEALKEMKEYYKNEDPRTGQNAPIQATRPASALQMNDAPEKNKQQPKQQLELEKEFQAGVEGLIIPPQIDLIREMSLLREPEAPAAVLRPEELELIREALREMKIQADADKTAAVIQENIAPAPVPVAVPAGEVDEAALPLGLMQLLAVEDMHTEALEDVAGIKQPVEPKPLAANMAAAELLATLNGTGVTGALAALEAAAFGAVVNQLDANTKAQEDKEKLVAVKEAITKPRLTFFAIDVDTHTAIDPLAYYDPEQVECRHHGAYFLPHPHDCRKYYLCAFGHMLQHQCGRGTGWNYQRQECEVRQLAECYATLPDDNEFEAPAKQPEDEQPFLLTPLTPDPYTTTPPYGDGAMVCYMYADGTTNEPTWSYTSSTGTWAPTGSYHTATTDDNWAPTGSSHTDPQFTPRTTTPVTTLSTEGADNGDHAILMCPMNGQAYLPHTKDCSKYYICIVGMPVLTSCPDGLYWDQKAEFCDLAKNVNCPQIQN